MDRSEVKAIVDAEIEPLMARLGIGHWKVVVSYDPSGADEHGQLKHGECTRLADYNSAHIGLNPESFDDAAMLGRTLRHELYHVVLAPFDLHCATVDRAVGDDAVRSILERIWDHACEKAVINLERMFVGLTRPESDD